MVHARVLLSVAALVFTAGLAGRIAASQISTGTGTPAPTPAPENAVPSNAPASVHGRVLAGDTGAPLRGATVHIMGGGSAAAPPLNRTAVTDRQGQYRFDDVPPGRYTINASRTGFVQMRAGQKHPLARGQLWTVPSTDRLDFILPRGGVIAGRLTDSSGEPLPGIRLTTLRVIYQPNGERLTPYTMMDGRSDDRGQFRVAGLMPGIYMLAAHYQSNETGEQLMTTYYPGTTNLHEAERIEIGLSEQVSASFSMLEGRPARISGYVRSSDGKPLQGARLALRTDQGVFENWGRVEDASGWFELSGVTPGDYVLEVSRSGAGGRPDFFKQTEFASVKLSVGKDDLTGLVVTTGIGTTVAGRVIYEGSSPTPTFGNLRRVYVEIVDASPGMRPPSSDSNNGRIADDGSFTVKGGYGKMLFRAGSPGWLLKSVSLNGVDMTDVPYDSSRGDIKDLEIVLTDRLQELSGTVVNASGRPATRYVVVVFPSDLPEGVVPGRFLRLLSPRDNGTFSINNLPPGGYLAAAFETIDQDIQWNQEFRKAITSRATPFHLSPGQTQRLELPLIE